MTNSRLLETAAHWAAILTALMAGSAYGWYRYERWQKRRKIFFEYSCK